MINEVACNEHIQVHLSWKYIHVCHADYPCSAGLHTKMCQVAAQALKVPLAVRSGTVPLVQTWQLAMRWYQASLPT